MILKIWFKCAAMHDPVCPKEIAPASISWEAKHRDIQLVIERSFKGEELVKRMKGWITVDPYKVIEIVNKYGKFFIDDSGELFVKIDRAELFDKLKEEMYNNFADEIILEIAKYQNVDANK